mgnify:CR=1 FL=1
MAFFPPDDAGRDRLWRLALGLVFLCAAAWRVANWGDALGEWTRDGIPVSDARALDTWAVNILDGIGFRSRVGFQLYEAFRMPFFSVVLAALYAVFGYHYFPVRVVLLLVSASASVGVAGIGRLLFNRRVGFLAGLLCALYYPFVHWSLAFMTETLFLFLLVLAVYLFLRSVHERGAGFAAGAGVALGLAAMTRVIAFAAAPVLAAYLAVLPAARGRKLRLALSWVAAMMIAFAPWVARNAIVFRAFFPSESGGVRQVWTGAHPKYAPTTYDRHAWRELVWTDPDASEMQQNRRAQRETSAMVRDQPGLYVRWMAWRVRHYLALPRLRDLAEMSAWPRQAHELEVWLAALLGYAGFLAALRKRPRAGLLLGGLFLAFVALHTVAGENPRYRLTSEWLWLLGAAYLLGGLLPPRAPDAPLNRSFLDRPALRALLLAVLASPFLVLAVRIPLNRAARLREAPVALPADPAAVLAGCGLAEEFARQGSVLQDIAYYREFAGHEDPEEIVYPAHVVMFAGEGSYFESRDDGTLKAFVLQVNKSGLGVGDARIDCEVQRGAGLRVPAGTAKLRAVVVGVLEGNGSLSEPEIDVADLLVDGRSLRGP